MPAVTKSFTSSRLRRATYDTATHQLDLHFDGRTVLAYKQVPEEVWRRLNSAPNPATYWEDRIAEEYPKTTPRKGEGDEGKKSWGDLFNDPPPEA